MPHSNPTFFSDHPPDNWDIIAYLNQHDPNSPTYNHQAILNKWTKSLTAIAHGEAYPSDQRDKARSLELKYHNPGRHSDRNRAREWFSQQTCTAKKVKSRASVTIYKAPVNRGTFVHSTFHQQVEAGSDAGYGTDTKADLGLKVDGPRATYEAPVNDGAFHDVTFNQAHSKRKLPQDWDSTADPPLNDVEVLNSESAQLQYSTPPPRSTEAKEQEHDDTEETTTKPPHPKKLKTDFLTTFTATYVSIPPTSKLRFTSTSRILEDIIYDNARTLSVATPAHQWILDLDDEAIVPWFEKTELDELRARMLPLPELDHVFVASMARFANANTAAEFRRVVEEVSYRAEGEAYDRAKHFDAAWVNTVVLSMLSILESPTNLLLYSALCEGWFDSNLWATLIDHCLLGLDGVLVQRKEIHCLALKHNTTSTHPPAPPHPRFDAIIHTLSDSPALEYGAIEVARSFDSVHTRKWTTDSAKLVRALRGMLARLQTLVEHDEAAVRALQVVGLMNAGACVQMVRVGALGVNVGWLQKGRVRSVPCEVPLLRSVFEVLRSVVVFKEIVKSTVGVVRDYRGRNRALTEQEFLRS